jgi:energy-coupling factor transport system permease protein
MTKVPASEFEFLRGLPFGPYLPVDSPLHRLDPRTRILAAVILMAALTISQRPLGLLIGLFAIVAVWRAARVPFEPLLRGWRAALPFLLILAGLQVLLRAGGRSEPALFILGPVVVSAADLLVAAALLLRFASFVAVLGLAAASLSESELTHGLQFLLKPLAVLRLPIYDIVAVVQVTLRYFPLLAQTAERIAKAQASRGADWSPAGWNLVQRARQIVPLIVPLFVTSLRRAENMALAMDARGYGSLPRRTSLFVLRYQLADYAALAVVMLLALIMVRL